MRTVTVPTAVLLAPLAVSVVAIAALIGLPQSELVWQSGAWALVVAALVLLVGLPLAAYSLVSDGRTRTWPRGIAFAGGTLYMTLLAVSALL